MGNYNLIASDGNRYSNISGFISSICLCWLDATKPDLDWLIWRCAVNRPPANQTPALEFNVFMCFNACDWMRRWKSGKWQAQFLWGTCSPPFLFGRGLNAAFPPRPQYMGGGFKSQFQSKMAEWIKVFWILDDLSEIMVVFVAPCLFYNVLYIYMCVCVMLLLPAWHGSHSAFRLDSFFRQWKELTQKCLISNRSMIREMPLKIVALFGNLWPAIPGAIVIWNPGQPLELELGKLSTVFLVVSKNGQGKASSTHTTST